MTSILTGNARALANCQQQPPDVAFPQKPKQGEQLALKTRRAPE